jgi:cell division protein FtsL
MMLIGRVSARVSTLVARLTLPARLHRPRIQRAAPFMAVVVSASLLFVGLFYVWTRMQIVQIGYEISELESKNKELANRKRELMLEIASLQSPQVLEKKARKQGLVIPNIDRVVHVP